MNRNGKKQKPTPTYTLQVVRHGYVVGECRVNSVDHEPHSAAEWLALNMNTSNESLYFDLSSAQFLKLGRGRPSVVQVEVKLLEEDCSVYHVRLDKVEKRLRETIGYFSLVVPDQLTSLKQLYHALALRTGRSPKEFKKCYELGDAQPLTDAQLADCHFLVADVDAYLCTNANDKLNSIRWDFHEAEGCTRCEVTAFMTTVEGAYTQLNTAHSVLQLKPHDTNDSLVRLFTKLQNIDDSEFKLVRFDRVDGGCRRQLQNTPHSAELFEKIGCRSPSFDLHFVAKHNNATGQSLLVFVHDAMYDSVHSTYPLEYYGPTVTRAATKVWGDERLREVDFGTVKYVNDNRSEIHARELLLNVDEHVYHVEIACRRQVTPNRFFYHDLHHSVVVHGRLDTAAELLDKLRLDFKYEADFGAQCMTAGPCLAQRRPLQPADPIEPFEYVRLVNLDCKCNFWLLKE